MVEAVRSQNPETASIPAPSTDPRSKLRILPAPKGKTCASPVRFAHPAETSIAALLDAHNVRWMYEPTTFPLITSEDGLPIQSFTPDFYLPDHDIYIEMTTMRQSLVTRKNRKFRLLRERYPELNVRLLYRRDVELILNQYGAAGLTGTTPGSVTPGSILVSDETIHRRIDDMSSTITEDATRPLTYVALGTGAVRFATMLASASNALVDVQIELRTMTIDRGNRNRNHSVEFGLSASIGDNSTIVLAADVIGTGLTAHAAITWLSERNLSVTHLVALADRRSARLIDLPLSASVVQAPSTWLVGSGVGGSDIAGLHLQESTPA